MAVSIKHLRFISPYKIILDTGDIVQAKCVKSRYGCSVQTNKHGNWYNKESIIEEYKFFLNNEIVDKESLKNFLKDKEKVKELLPNEDL